MPINISHPDALDKLAAVEGQRWRNLNDIYGPNSFAAIKAGYEEWLAAHPALANWTPEFGVTFSSKECAIYGAGGWSRYIVMNHGEIVFLPGMSPSQEKTETAQKIGFRMWP